MNLTEARQLAEAEMDRLIHKKTSQRWTFEWNRSNRVFGTCSPRRRVITLSPGLTQVNDREAVHDTILHEIAHALDWIRNCRAGHSWTWKRICVEIGARPQRCYTVAEVVGTSKHKYELRHCDTKEVFGRYLKFPTKLAARLGQTWIRNRQRETQGKLEIICTNTGKVLANSRAIDHQYV